MEATFHQDQALVRAIEAAAPPHAMVFQLPYVAFPESPPRYQMQDYEQLRPGLHSRTLRWSYGAMKGRAEDRWLAEVSGLAAPELAAALGKAGFAGILVNRLGYLDHATALEAQLRNVTGRDPIVDGNRELAYFPLMDAPR